MLFRNILLKHGPGTWGGFEELNDAYAWRNQAIVGSWEKHYLQSVMPGPRVQPHPKRTRSSPARSPRIPMGTNPHPSTATSPSPPHRIPRQQLWGLTLRCKAPGCRAAGPPGSSRCLRRGPGGASTVPGVRRAIHPGTGLSSPLSTPTPPLSFPEGICQVSARWNFTLLF